MCTKCDANQILTNKGKEQNCPFCRTPAIYANDPKYESQVLIWAEKGKSWAQCILGDLYYYEEYVKKNIEKAFYYYNLAADQGHPIAQGKLGDIYLEGEGVSVD